MSFSTLEIDSGNSILLAMRSQMLPVQEMFCPLPELQTVGLVGEKPSAAPGCMHSGQPGQE